MGGRLHVVVGQPVRQYLSGMARRGGALDPELAKYREMWVDELGGAALYRALAEHADEHRRPIFLSLAEAEERHAAHWAERMRQGVMQPYGELAVEPVMDVQVVADAVLHMASLPLDANVLFMTVMATKMPYIGRG